MRVRWVSLFGLLCHCASGPRVVSPRASLSSLAVAANAGDAEVLYGLLPEQARREESREAFGARMTADRAELRDLGRRVALSLQQLRAPAAVVALTSGDNAYLQEDAAGFGLTHPGFGAAAAPMPVDALRSLRAALTRGNLGGLQGVLSASAQGSLDAQVRSLIDALRDPAALELTRTGTQCMAQLPDGRTIVLVQEGDQWRVDDILDGVR